MNFKGVSPFDGMQIDPHDPLNKVTTRTKCPECGSSRKYFCYTCYLPMPEVTGVYNTVELPLMVDIIKHPAEVDGKSTAVHARLLAPDHVKIYTYPNIPHFENKEKILLVFPCKDAVSLEDLSKSRIPQSGSTCMGKEDTSSQSDVQQKCDPHGADLPTSSQTANNISDNSHNVSTSNMSNAKGYSDSSNDVDSAVKELITPETDPIPSTTPQKNCESECHGLSEELSRLVQISEKDNNGLDNISTNAQKSPVEEKEGVSPYDRVIFIDSTWNQFGVIIRDERLAEFKRVILTSRTTTFWRTQHNKPDTYLATIEAIYYFLVDYHKIMLQRDYNGQYDNLLFFYSFLHGLVKKAEEEKEAKESQVQKKR